MKKIIFFTLTTCLFSACTTFNPHSSEKMDDEMGSYVFKASNGIILPYRIYIPHEIGGRIPLVMFLHGAGQRGNDNLKQLYSGDVGYLVSYSCDTEPSVILAPQCPETAFWKTPNVMEALSELLHRQISIIPFIDSSRIYVTGFSMGGEATWIFATKNPGIVKAIMPVCGGPLNGQSWEDVVVSKEMGNMGIWAYNNLNDGVVQNSFSKYILMKTWEFDMENSHMTENLEGGHSSEGVYSDIDKIDWLYSNGAK